MEFFYFHVSFVYFSFLRKAFSHIFQVSISSDEEEGEGFTNQSLEFANTEEDSQFNDPYQESYRQALLKEQKIKVLSFQAHKIHLLLGFTRKTGRVNEY